VWLLALLMMGAMPARADDGTSVPPRTPSQEPWAKPAASVVADPQDLVEQSGDTGAVTIVYAVQDGDELRIETQRVTTPERAEAAIDDVQRQDDVLAVDVDAPRTLTAEGVVTANDPRRPEQWALDALGAESAWLSSTGGGVTVAVVDSGVAPHPDLAGAFVPGVDLVNGTDGRVDRNGHGTHVAGIIAMTANNARGGAGLAPDVSLMPVVVAKPDGSVRASDSAKGIIWAADNGADVINMSYSGAASTVEQKAIEYAQSKGATTVAAAGNAYLDDSGRVYNPVQYPAAFTGVIGVGAVTRTLKRSRFSEVGKQVDIVAPGGSGAFDSARGIFSTWSDAAYVRMPGTSMAAPYVSATLALAIARMRELGVTSLPADVVLGTALDLGPPGRDNEFGFGLVNPAAALELVDTVLASGVAAPSIKTAEVTTRVVRKLRVKVRRGSVRYRIRGRGTFRVAWQRFVDRSWSDPVTLKAKRKGKRWHTLDTTRPWRMRLLAVRTGSGKADPIWVSRTFRAKAPPRG
jgi:subtilisin family serine protease